MSAFAKRLVHARADAGLTQRQLSEMTGISSVQLSRYESGKSTPRLPLLMKLAKALSVNHKWLGGDDASEKNEIHEYELDLPEDLYEKSVALANDLGIPLELLAKYMLFLGSSTLENIPPSEREKMADHAEALRKRIEAITAIKKQQSP